MDVDLNLFYSDSKERFAKMRFSEVSNTEKLLNYVQNKVSQEYKDTVVVSENIPNMPCIEGEVSEYSIGIHFDQIGDSTNLVRQIDNLFGECKHYNPIGSMISER